jgi:hypothetical protein
VWHASVSVAREVPWKFARKLALKALAGVGAAELGQWEERGRVAYHIRRRLSPEEAAIVGEVCDLRGTLEATARFERIKKELPFPALAMAYEELSDENRVS